jgi:hypothetical protein
MGVSSSLKIHPASVSSFVNYKGVIMVIELSISLDGCFEVAFVARLFDMRGNESPNPFEGIYV